MIRTRYLASKTNLTLCMLDNFACGFFFFFFFFFLFFFFFFFFVCFVLSSVDFFPS